MIILEDEFETKKEIQARQLLKRGHATLKELLELNYGEWPLRGLDIVTDDHLKREVSLLPAARLIVRILSNKKTETKDKFAYLKETYTSFIAKKYAAVVFETADKREIWYSINRLNDLFERAGQATTNHVLAHERRHIQQFDPSNPLRAKEMFGTGFFEEGLTRGYLGTEFVSPVVYQMIQEHLKDMSTFSQVWKQISSDNKIGTKKLRPIERQKEYLQNGLEIQARMEELLSIGYPTWPHMPLTRHELWAAMIDMGFKPPEEVQKILDADPLFEEARNRFSTNHKIIPTSLELNWAIDNLPTEKARLEFWLVTMPILYGDILESFGDRQGRIRMGSPVNLSLPFLLFGKQYDACHAPHVDKKTYQDIAHKAQIYGSALSAEFIDYFYKTKPQDAQNENSRIVNPASEHFIMAMIQAPGVAEVLSQHSSPVMDWVHQQPRWSAAEPSIAFRVAPASFQK